MGWTFCGPSMDRAKLIDYLTSPRYLGSVRILRKAVVGNHLWMALAEDPAKGDKRQIVLFLLASGGRGEGYGYKDMSESAGPVQVDCPLALLELVPEPDDHNARTWRARVRTYHEGRRTIARKRRALKPGDILTWQGVAYSLERCLPSGQWLVIRRSDGEIFRLTGRLLHLAIGETMAAQAALLKDAA